MKELEKILEEIENERTDIDDYSDAKSRMLARHWNSCIDVVEDIIRKHMNDGWIPVEKRLPEDDRYIFLSFENFSLPMIGRYEQDSDGSGNFYIGDETESCISQDLYVTAWRPLPEPYRPERSEK